MRFGIVIRDDARLAADWHGAPPSMQTIVRPDIAPVIIWISAGIFVAGFGELVPIVMTTGEKSHNIAAVQFARFFDMDAVVSRLIPIERGINKELLKLLAGDKAHVRKFRRAGAIILVAKSLPGLIEKGFDVHASSSPYFVPQKAQFRGIFMALSWQILSAPIRKRQAKCDLLLLLVANFR
jgi:hypothetical protein